MKNFTFSLPILPDDILLYIFLLSILLLLQYFTGYLISILLGYLFIETDC